MTDEELKQLVASNARAIADMQTAIADVQTTSFDAESRFNQRFDRIQHQIESIAVGARQAFREQSEDVVSTINSVVEGLAETRNIAESNARSIQANSSTGADNQRAIASLATEVRQTFRDQAEDVVSMISDLAGQQAFLTEQQSRLNQVTTDSFEAIKEDFQQVATNQKTTDQQIQVLVEEGRADRLKASEQRQANETEHQAFRENIQRLLLDIQRIWQQLNGGSAA
ncbi:MAG: hypothetical protein F6K19_05145 [Cyanothece sp. SIO1E1]|nr:hypothetical protein [Cyanothece sp. SIO1E1]